jgi:hypothetical protein
MREEHRRARAGGVNQCLLLTQSGHDSSYAITKFLFDLNQIQGSRAQTIVMISSRGQLRCTSTPKDIV